MSCDIFVFSCFILYNLATLVCSDNIAIVILSQDNEFHHRLFKTKQDDINKLTNKFIEHQVQIFSSHQLLENEVGHWTIFPILQLQVFKDFHWLVFLEDLTSIHFENILAVFKKYNSSMEVFAGYALKDSEPTIIHHFADPDLLVYPHFHAGFFLSGILVQRLKKFLSFKDENLFSIDSKYELAKFIMNKGVQLQHESHLCLKKFDNDCASWIDYEFPYCGAPVPSEELRVAVKTCDKFHDTRVSVVKNTWGPEAGNLIIFSNVKDDSLPTVKVPVENVDHGHCEKTLSIMKFYIDQDIPFSWLTIVDDDTLISIKRLRKLLSCYNSSEIVALGERYGYSSVNGFGYDYITGGGGMVFSRPTIKLLVQSCKCPAVDSPDDMIIGMCLKQLGIPVIHSPYFHQARPVDYSPDFLSPFKHISFHKHWMIDPYSVYREWLRDSSESGSHTEL